MTTKQSFLPLNLANPYDFANPVSSKELFIGREEERREIEYYLNHARDAARSINLAILGERAAGKTSLLNLIEIEATERDLMPVRIDLNESDVEAPLAFWFKVFDGIFNKAVTMTRPSTAEHVFGGVAGATYDTYLSMISSYDVPTDKTFCPFIFPIQYAMACRAGNASARVSDQVLKRDFFTLSSEVRRPIILLIDECNLLSAHRSLLEMVRNTFMNLRGYMLVFTGTPDLFPLMDAVFSPITRQFKRIEVAPFASINDTRDAIVNPLIRINQDKLFDMPSERLHDLLPPHFAEHQGSPLRDVHDLTAGRPYEIQLVCHFMFKRVQAGKDSRMRLSFDVIEDVLRELKQTHDIDARPIISAVKSFELSDLNLLNTVLQSSGKTPVSHVGAALYITQGAEVEPDRLAEHYERFIDLGIFENRNGCAVFRGDDFDRIVCKYAARQRKVSLSFLPRSFGSYFEQRVIQIAADRELSKQGKVFNPSDIATPILPNQRREVASDLHALNKFWDESSETKPLLELLDAVPAILRDIYASIFKSDYEQTQRIRVLRLDVNVQDAEYTGYFALKPSAFDNHTEASFDAAIATMTERASQIGGVVAASSRLFSLGNPDVIFESIIQGESKDKLEYFANEHAGLASIYYLIERDRDQAVRHAVRAARCVNSLKDSSLNDVGYVLLSAGKTELAATVLERAIEQGSDLTLVRYNLAVAVAELGRRAEAKALFDEVIEREKATPYQGTGVLLFLALHDGDIVTEERWVRPMGGENCLFTDKICLSEAAKLALTVLGALESEGF